MKSKISITPAMLALMKQYHRDGEIILDTPYEQAMGLVIYNIITAHPLVTPGKPGGDGQFSGGYYQEHYNVGNTEISIGLTNGTVCDISFKLIITGEH